MDNAGVLEDCFVIISLFVRLTGNHLLQEVLLGHSWTERTVSMLIKEVLDAVSHIHQEGIVHLDIQVILHSYSDTCFFY